MKRCVILVNSLYNIILALQLRRSLFAQDEFDLVLSDEAAGLDEVYGRHILDRVFDHVYFADTKCLTRADRAKGLIRPGSNYARMLGLTEMPDYTDIFMWNPDRVFYSLYMEYNRLKKPFDLHVYGEALAGWFKDAPDTHTTYELYSRTFEKNLIRRRYGFKRVMDMDYDYYIFSPKWAVCDMHHDVVEIPSIDKSDRELIGFLNEIFNYDPSFRIDEKLIYLGTVPGAGDSEENIKRIVKDLKEICGDDFIVKRHPRDDLDIYDGVKCIKEKFIWDLYCLNNDIDDKIVLSYTSTAVLIPSAIYGVRPRVIMYQSPLKGVEFDLDMLRRFLEKFNSCGAPIELVTDTADLMEKIKDLFDKENKEEM